MEAEVKEIIKEKEYIHGDKYGRNYRCEDDCCHEKKEYASKGLAGTALGFGIGGAVLGAAALWGRGGRGIGGGGVPENVNINANGFGMNGSSHVAPTAFEVQEKECEDVLALTNTLWGLKVNTMEQMYAHRQTDIAEKFALHQSQVQADFDLYKSQRDGFDALSAKQNADAFALYKAQRDGFDATGARISDLEKRVAVNEAIRPYQDKLIQCEIEKAFTAGINYVDRRMCRVVLGEVVLPNTPVVSGYAGATPCCNRPVSEAQSA